MTYCGKKCSSDREKFLKIEAAGREFLKFLKSLEQFIQTVKGQNNLTIIRIQIGKLLGFRNLQEKLEKRMLV